MFCCPDKNCDYCPRLAAFRTENRRKFPQYHNAPVDSFGDLNAEVLVVGLAPGLHGANQTGRPFTNDYAGDVLYPCLKKYGFAAGEYQRRKDDGFNLRNVRVTNSVRCVPPQNKVTTEETKCCGAYLRAEINAMPDLKIILCLGAVAHGAVLSALGCKKSTFKFAHGALHDIKEKNIILADSYHTSRYNINTGVLTAEMFAKVIEGIAARLKSCG